MIENVGRAVGAVDNLINYGTYRAVEFASRHAIFNKWKLLGAAGALFAFLNPDQAGQAVSDVTNFAREAVGQPAVHDDYAPFYD